jgi:hypothetical protein
MRWTSASTGELSKTAFLTCRWVGLPPTHPSQRYWLCLRCIFIVNLPHGQEIQDSLGVRCLLLMSILRLVRLNGVSVFWQAASTLAETPSRYPAGSTLTYQAIGPRTVEMWTFTVGATEKLALPGGEVSAIRLWREAAHENDAKGEVWLAPSMDYLPVRIRLTKGSNEMIDQKWRATLKP